MERDSHTPELRHLINRMVMESEITRPEVTGNNAFFPLLKTSEMTGNNYFRSIHENMQMSLNLLGLTTGNNADFRSCQSLRKTVKNIISGRFLPTYASY